MKTYNFFDWVSNTVQDCSNSIANALDLLQSCTKPSISPMFRIPALILGCTLAMYWNHGWPAWADLAYQKYVTEWCFGYWCTVNHHTWSWDWAAQGGISKTHMSSWIWELLKLECCTKVISFNVWVRYFVWNFKGDLWNSTQNIIPIHWKMQILFTGENLRALRFKSSQVFFETPPAVIQPIASLWYCLPITGFPLGWRVGVGGGGGENHPQHRLRSRHF